MAMVPKDRGLGTSDGGTSDSSFGEGAHVNNDVDSLASSFGGGAHVNIDVDSLASSLKNTMSQNLSVSQKCSIFRVPYILRRHNEEAYIPTAFSIGPWHHNNSKFKPTGKVKQRYLKDLLSRATCGDTMLKEMIKAIGEIEQEARDCYSGLVCSSVDDLVKILVLDGCFIIELLQKDDDKRLRDPDDPVFTMSCMIQYLHYDLLLLENQIPWKVLERLFSLTGLGQNLVELALKFFTKIFSFTSPPPVSHNHKKQNHLLDLLRNWLVLSCEEKEDHKINGWQTMPSATNLVNAGIKFRVEKSRSILDIKFRNGVLEIPSLLIQESTEVIFRNLISYEQCYPGCSPMITSYVILLYNLIGTDKDVNILIQKGVIDNWLIAGDASQFFMKLYQDTYLKRYYYLDVCRTVNEYCHRIWPRLRVTFKLGTPLIVVSQIGSVILLILTVLQTIFSIKK